MLNKYKLYLHDLGFELRDSALEAKKRYDEKKETDAKLFHEGYLCGFHRVVDMMQQMSIGFDIPLEELGLDKIDPYKDLM